ncbi:MAG: signal transduction histidine kinase [Bacilli bacterium]|nr:signal transduction histidine kinase [Bacilli bacterium]
MVRALQKKNQSQIFSPFFSTKNRTLNFGLGLSYCYTILQKSGLSIKFESEVNKGTTFFIVFPNKKIIREFKFN